MSGTDDAVNIFTVSDIHPAVNLLVRNVEQLDCLRYAVAQMAVELLFRPDYHLHVRISEHHDEIAPHCLAPIPYNMVNEEICHVTQYVKSPQGKAGH